MRDSDVYTVLDEISNDNITLAGPTPRLRFDAGIPYEGTPAFAADLSLKRIAAEKGAHFVPYLGRSLTSMSRRRHVLREDVARQWFARDGIHLSRLGYDKIAKKLGDLFR